MLKYTGTIVFSNEPDKYYKYKIIEQIDYEKLLEFKTASVRLHCQPFKYPLEEEPLEIEYEYVNGEGETITLDNTEEDIKMSIDPKGNTKQDTTNGNNLIDTSGGTTQTLNDVTFTPTYNSKGELQSIKVNGTASAMNSYIFPNYVTLKAGTYYISKQTSNNVHLLIVDSNGSSYVSTSDTEKSFTLSEDKSVRLWLRVYSGTSISNAVLYPMVAKTSGATYEPYTNGASPNPSYPQKIHSVTGDNEVVVCGKNLFSLENANVRGWDCYILNPLKTIGDYAVSCVNDYPVANKGVALAFASELDNVDTGYFCGYVLGAGSKSVVHYVTESQANAKYLVIRSSEVTNINNLNSMEIMLEKNSQATTYEPYQSQTYPINLTCKNLFDKNGLTYRDGYYLNDNGVEQSNSAIGYTSNIKVQPSTQYTIQGTLESNDGYFRVYYFDSTKTWISRTSGIPVSSIPYTFTTPNNCGYIDIQYQKTALDKDTIQLEKGSQATSFQPYTTPIELCKIGDYQDYFTKNSGKNLISSVTRSSNQLYFNGDSPNTPQYSFKAGTYTFSYNDSNSVHLYYKTPNSQSSVDLGTNKIITFSVNENFVIWLYRSGMTDNEVSNVMLNEGTTALPYEPYGTGQWCKYNAIGKVVLDGTENWGSNSGWNYTNTNNYYTNLGLSNDNLLSTHFTYEAGTYTLDINGIMQRVWTTTLLLRISKTLASDVDAFKTWLGTNNTIVYYVLSTPYLSLIEDTILIEQLDNIQNAMSYEGQTNVMQNNNDLPFYLIASAMKQNSNEVIVNNIGNIYAKPTLDIEGSGIINIYKDNNQILQLNMDDTNEIVFEDMNAFDPATNELKNRKVTGNYNNVTIPSGESIIKVDGNLTKMTITNYTRWL